MLSNRNPANINTQLVDERSTPNIQVWVNSFRKGRMGRDDQDPKAFQYNAKFLIRSQWNLATRINRKYLWLWKPLTDTLHKHRYTPTNHLSVENLPAFQNRLLTNHSALQQSTKVSIDLLLRLLYHISRVWKGTLRANLSHTQRWSRYPVAGNLLIMYSQTRWCCPFLNTKYI